MNSKPADSNHNVGYHQGLLTKDLCAAGQLGPLPHPS